MIATCGKVTVAEVEELVEVGELDPDEIHTPGIFVDRIVQGEAYEKRIEFRTVQGAAASKKESPIRNRMARRAAQELRDGYFPGRGQPFACRGHGGGHAGQARQAEAQTRVRGHRHEPTPGFVTVK